MKFTTILFISFWIQNIYSQNLVPNGSFEDRVSCELKTFRMDTFPNICKHWSSIRFSTPDYLVKYKNCDTRGKLSKNLVTSPHTPYGYKEAIGGDHFAGIGFLPFKKYPYSEYLFNNLTTKLQAGKNYKVSFYISLADSSCFFLNKIGFCIGNKLKENVKSNNKKCFVRVSCNNPLIFYLDPEKQRNNWLKLEMDYQAKGGEDMISIGFFDEVVGEKEYSEIRKNQKVYEHIPDDEPMVYYFLDDVQIEAIESSNPISDSIIGNSKIEEKPKATYTLENVFFKLNSSIIDTSSYPSLDSLSHFLNRNASIEIQIIGHTDSVGSQEYNQRLSEERALSIYNFLIKKGISKNRLSYIGKGDQEKISNGFLDENRRAEIKITKQ